MGTCSVFTLQVVPDLENLESGGLEAPDTLCWPKVRPQRGRSSCLWAHSRIKARPPPLAQASWPSPPSGLRQLMPVPNSNLNRASSTWTTPVVAVGSGEAPALAKWCLGPRPHLGTPTVVGPISRVPLRPEGLMTLKAQGAQELPSPGAAATPGGPSPSAGFSCVPTMCQAPCCVLRVGTFSSVPLEAPGWHAAGAQSVSLWGGDKCCPAGAPAQPRFSECLGEVTTHLHLGCMSSVFWNGCSQAVGVSFPDILISSAILQHPDQRSPKVAPKQRSGDEDVPLHCLRPAAGSTVHCLLA